MSRRAVRPRPRAPRLLLALVGALAVLAAPVAVAAPAQAHNQLIQVDPKDGSASATGPKQITLTFNESVQNLPGSKSNQIVVKDRNGKEFTTGDVRIKGATLSRSLKPLPKGTYDVQWSALSQDGHRVSGDGNYSFTVTKGVAAPSSAAPSTEASSAAASSEAASSQDAGQVAGSAGSLEAGSSSAAAQEDGGKAPTTTVMWVVGGFLVVAILLGIILQVTRRKDPKEH